MRDGDELAFDEERLELPTIQRVQEEAASLLADLVRERLVQASCQ